MKSIAYWPIQIALILLAALGGREIATATRTSEELLELKDQKIELLESRNYEEEKLDRIDRLIKNLETNDLYQGSVYKGLVMAGMSLGLGLLNAKYLKAKKENQSVLTIQEAARPES